MTRRKTGAAILLATVAIAAVAVGVWAFSGDEEGRDDFRLDLARPKLGVIDEHLPEVGKIAPDFALVNARDSGEIIRLSDFRGRPVIVNWYASWVPPSRSEIPELLDVLDALEGELVILGVDLQEPAEQALDLLDQFGATYPVVLDGESSVFKHYGGVGLPTTYFIDADGILVEAVVGRVTAEVMVRTLAKLGLDYEPPRDD